MERRDFLKTTAVGSGVLMTPGFLSASVRAGKKPNIIYVFADQWRAQATGYNGDPNLIGNRWGQVTLLP